MVLSQDLLMANITPPSLTTSLSLPTSPSSNYNHIINLVSVKLDPTNHLLWKSQFLTIFRTHNLMGFIDGSKPCPPETILADKDLVPNPAHLTWITQDQYIASWLMATLSENILSQVVSPTYQSALSIWSKVEQICVSSSKLHALQLRGQLQNLKKLYTPMDDYIQSIKKISNTLIAVGSPLSDSDLFFYTLGGLGPDYETFITTVSLQHDTILFDNLCTLLRHRELRLASIHNTTSPTALTANTSSSSILGQLPQKSQSSPPSFRYRGRGRGRGSFSPRPNNSTSSNPTRPLCQVCKKAGHEVLDCYNRLNMAYQGRNPSRQIAALNLISDQSESEWLPDTGATDHVTADLSNLSLNNEYQGSNHVSVGNGEGLLISHIGRSVISSPSRTFLLNNILCVPSIKRNLLSVAKFTKDNHCFFEFHPTHFVVKDLQSNRLLLQGTMCNGLYLVKLTQSSHESTTPVSPPSAYTAASSSSQVWHRRLGHPSSDILKRIFECL